MPARRSVNPVVALAVLVALGACTAKVDSAGPPPPQQGVAVVVTPPSSALLTGETAQFAAQVTGTAVTSVTWQVDEANGGTIDDAGRYTAPGTAGTFHVRATSDADPSAWARSAVTVTAPGVVTLALAPTAATMDACTSRTFTATVSGTTDRVVTWSIAEGAAGGSVTTAGVYTAPENPGTYHLVATAHAAPGPRATATITVAEHVLSIAVDPPAPSLSAGAVQQFTATVTTTCGVFVARSP